MSGYIGTQPVPQATQTRDSFTATAGQTSFATGGYTPSFLDVYLNGVHLQNGTDYTATNGSDVVLAVGAALNDIVETVAYTTFETSNNATLAQGALADSAVQPNDSPAFATVTVTNISDGTDTVETGYVVNGSAKAWVHASNAAVILDSLNVSSGLDNGVGDYTYTYTAALASTSYSSQANVRVSSTSAYIGITNFQLTTTINVGTYRTSTDARNDRENSFTAFGDLV